MDIPVFNWISLFIPIVVLAPNLLWLLFPPINISVQEVKEPLFLTILENLGRLGVTVIPLFYKIVLVDSMSYVVLIIMLLLLAIYYYGWFRFYICGRNHIFLFLPLWRIPIPMAVSPVLYFVLAAKLLQSIPMLFAALLLAIGHILISYKEYCRIAKTL
ncbi:MAG: putative rane protein [Firmicutes bacterium]|nr:putative rane protein [Bacillota bacterium]